MDEREFQKNYEKSYHFFLSELKGIKTEDLAFIVELMRCSQHIKDIQKLMVGMNPGELSEEKEMIYWSEHDSLITMILNICAAQLRESLKLFWKFSETEFFQGLIQELSKDNRLVIDGLVHLNEEYKEKKGFIWEVLEPVRNSMFHYLPEKAIPWIDKTKSMERERKPHFQTVNPEEYDFGVGKEYDKEIYSKYLFWGNDGFNFFMKAQKQLFEIQLNFLKSTSLIVEVILTKEKISKRKYGWFMDFFQGYKS